MRTNKVKPTNSLDPHFLRERMATRLNKRLFINNTRWQRHIRRLSRLSVWTLTDLGRAYLANDDSGGDDDQYFAPIQLGELSF